jgi:hypothetical protein
MTGFEVSFPRYISKIGIKGTKCDEIQEFDGIVPMLQTTPKTENRPRSNEAEFLSERSFLFFLVHW